MKTRSSTKALILATVTLAGVTFSLAQNNPKPADSQHTFTSNPANAKFDMLAQLGLAREQKQEIRRLNAERKPLMQSAQLRLREANRLLDEAIYADVIDESAIEERLREVQSSQGDIQRIRNSGELAIRKLLTPEQLVRFRELRQRFERGRIRQEVVERRQNVNRRRTDVPLSTPANNQPIRQFLKQRRQR